jgi:small subunit ribosomal protein S2
MPRTEFKQLLDAGVHFGHLKRKWNPNMAPYIFMEKNGIHIIDLQKTIVKIDEAAAALKSIAKSGRKVLFVATKKQAKTIVSEHIKETNMPYITERWSAGTLTNFPTIRKAVKKMTSIDKMMKDTSWDNLSKREKLQITRQRAKLDKVLGSIADLSRLPAALFVVDVMKEKIAVREAQRLNIPVFAMVDTNSNPQGIEFVIPANDDASQSIDLIIGVMAEAVKEGLSERKIEREKEGGDEKQQKQQPARQKRGSRKAAAKEAEPVKEEAPKAEPVKEEAPKAGPVKEEAKEAEPVKEEAPKAEPVKEEAKEAEPVKEEAPKAEPVKEEAPKAGPVKEEAKEAPVAKEKKDEEAEN